MSLRPGRGRLALRIYVVSVTAVLAAALAAGLLMHAFRPAAPPHGAPQDAARWAAALLAERWGAPGGLEPELEDLGRYTHLRGTLFDADGRPVASTTPAPLAPPSPEEQGALRVAGAVERGACTAERCVVVAALRRGAEVVGWAVLERGPRRLPPAVPALALLLVGLGIAAAFLGSAIARPLDRLAATARELGAGRLEARTGIRRHDELGTVARAFDEMAAQVARLLQSHTELVANVAHELRTPLARIRVALDLAEDGDAAMARESLAEIAQDLAELERLVDDILASARMELAGQRSPGGAPPLRVDPIDVGALVASCVDRLRQRHPDRQVEAAVAPALPQLHGDTVLLRRALDNLLDNARKYSAPDTVVRLRATGGGGEVTIEVADAGEGIAPEDLERLFTPFFRADRSRARATGGVGLGLALARRIVEAHGGTLVAASTVGVGTTMTIRLPVAGAAQRASAASAA